MRQLPDHYLVAHPVVAKIVFRGSVATDKSVMATGAKTLKRMTLELGGNDAGIVLPGTDIEPLLDKLFWGCFLNGGQTCAALKRLFVHESQYEEIVNAFADHVATIRVGNGLDPKTQIGPLTNRMGGSIWTNDPIAALPIAERLECGTAWINQHGTLHPMAPFGGIKSSGIGVEFNIDGLREYTTVQVLHTALRE